MHAPSQPRRTVARIALQVAALATIALCALSATALESQARPVAEAVPAAIERVFPCGQWSAGGARGRYRVVLASVDAGTGTEVYLQRMQEPDGAGAVQRVLETTPVRELNDDHGRYLVTAATCVGAGLGNAVELRASYEHDTGDLEHRIRIVLAAPGAYRVIDTTPRSRRR